MLDINFEKSLFSHLIQQDPLRFSQFGEKVHPTVKIYGINFRYILLSELFLLNKYTWNANGLLVPRDLSNQMQITSIEQLIEFFSQDHLFEVLHEETFDNFLHNNLAAISFYKSLQTQLLSLGVKQEAIDQIVLDALFKVYPEHLEDIQKIHQEIISLCLQKRNSPLTCLPILETDAPIDYIPNNVHFQFLILLDEYLTFCLNLKEGGFLIDFRDGSMLTLSYLEKIYKILKKRFHKKYPFLFKN